MANRSDIEAGKAHVTMWLKKDALVAGLKSVQGIINDAGAKFMQVGAGVMAVGGAVVFSLAAAVGVFADIGGELADMSARTGIAAGALAELKYGAEQSGASIDDVEKATKKMQQTFVDAAAGSKSAAEKFAAAGVSLDELTGKNPDEQLILVGKAIAEIEDPARRTAVALDVFGKSGAALVPMFAEIDELAAEARELGLVPTESAVQDAAKIGDLWDKIKSVAMATVFEIGAALAPVLIPMLETTVKIAAAISKWVRENAQLVRTIAAISAGLVAAGGIIFAIGGSLVALGAVIGSISAIIGAIGPILAAVFSPIGLIVMAIAAVGVGIVMAARHWLFFTESGKKALAAIQAFFKPFVDAIKTAFGGIVDAFKAGNLGLAANIAMEGMKVIFFRGIDEIVKRIMFIPQAIINSLKSIASLDRTGWLTSKLELAEGALNAIAAVPGTAANAAQVELDKLRAQAAAERASKEAAAATEEKKKYVPGGEEADPVAAAVDKMKSFGSFSVSALTMQNWGKNPQDKVVNVLERTYEEVVSGRKAIVTAIKEAAPAYGP